MRDRGSSYSITSSSPNTGQGEVHEIVYDEKRFFESFYSASSNIGLNDRTTMGNDFSLMEARFHYNVTECAIIKAIARDRPSPHGPMVAAIEASIKRKKLRLLDLGSGTGHWVDFFRDVFLVTNVAAVEITDQMADYLRGKYADDPAISIIQEDVCSDDFTVETIGGACDYISAIGVMFHIVDDKRWHDTLVKLASLLKPDGLLIVGGDFGPETKNIQHHKIDDFKTWREYNKAQTPEAEILVNKRVRSLADWQRAANIAGLVIADLVRSDFEPGLRTPENDILLLKPA